MRLPKLPKAVLADLRRSGHDAKDGACMAITFIPVGSERHERLRQAFVGLRVPCYAIPYFGTDGKPTGFVRFRLLGEYRPKGSDKPAKYLQLPGSGAHLYFPPILNWKVIGADTSQPIYLVEGEKKAFAMAKLGLAAVGLGGVENFSADGAPIKDFFGRVNWKRSVGIVFDSDKFYNANVMRAQDRLAKTLVSLGANPHTVDLPLAGDGKVAADDFIVRHRAKARAAFDALPRTWLFRAPALDFDHLLETKLPEQGYVVKGLFPVGVTLVVGGPKIGKSAFMLDVAYSLKRGEPILNEFLTTPTETFYAALEDTPSRLQRRGHALREASRRAAKLGRQKLKKTTAAERPLRLTTHWPRGIAETVRAVEQELHAHPHTRLFIFDTFAKISETPKPNSNVYRSDYDAITPLKQIADRHHVAIVLVHHTRKASSPEDVVHEINGSNALAAAADATLIFKRKRNESDGTLHIVGRDVEERQIAVRWNFPRWTSLGDAQDHRLSLDRREILEVLLHEPTGMTRPKIAAAVKKKYQATRYLVDRLKDDGLVSVDEKSIYKITRTGEQLLKGDHV